MYGKKTTIIHEYLLTNFYLWRSSSTRVVRKVLGLCRYLKNIYAIQIKIYLFIDKAFLKNIWQNWNQNLHTLGDIGLQGNRCSASRSTLNFVFSKIWRQENNCQQIGHMAFKYSNNLHGVTPSSVQYVHKIPWSFDG